MRKVLVLGSNSFSGQDFVDLLLDDPENRVIGVSRSPARPDIFLRYRERSSLSRFMFHQIDMNTSMSKLFELLDLERPSHIVNFAAQSEVGPSWSYPEHWFQTNTVALAKLINLLSKCNFLQRYLHISSPEVYGTCHGTVKEDARPNPSTPYAASKASADMILDVYRKQFNFPLLTVRATNVYGARQQLFKIIPRSAIYLKLGTKIQLHGGGQAVKSYIHVRDVSKGELAILLKGEVGRTYHLSPTSGVSVRSVVENICRAFGKDFAKSTEVVAERPGQDAAYVIDSTLARTTLGWEPSISLEEGINEVVEWVNTNWDFIKSYPLEYEHKL